MNVEKIEELKRAVNEALDLLFDRQEEDVEQSREFEESLKEFADYCRSQRNNNPCPCEHSEEEKPEYKPYESVEEFIQDYQERFPTAVPRPAHTMPLIWLTNIVSEEIHLVTGFNMTDENENEKGVCIRDIILSFRELFGSWIFLDGSPCGKEC